jgi:hypothetical protein
VPAGAVVQVAPRAVLATVGTVTVAGGYGSAMARDPADPRAFYLLTDRGPNYDVGADVKAFVDPAFAPRIGRFRLTGGELWLERAVILRAADGAPLSGLPNPAGSGGTGESAVRMDGTALAFDPAGVDPEGLAALADGTFWVSEEYGPRLLHVARDGRTLERVGVTEGRCRLPAVLAARRPNRGIEGLAVLPSGALVAALEAPLDNPRAAGRASRVVRLLRLDPRTCETRQYVYLLERPDVGLADITAASDTVLYVIERDTRLPGDSAAPSAVKRIYRVSLAGASDVSGPADAPAGRRFDGRTLEELDSAALARAGITPVGKVLVADLLALGYPHSKPEGLAVMDDSTIAVSNDDDFGVADADGRLAPKILPQTGAVDVNTVWFVRLQPPRP